MPTDLAPLVPPPETKDAFIKMASYPLIKHTDMESEMRTEAMEICTSAVEKVRNFPIYPPTECAYDTPTVYSNTTTYITSALFAHTVHSHSPTQD